MECQKCESPRVLFITGKVSDRFDMELGDKMYTGYVPQDIGIGGGDYVEFDYCLDCGQIQGEFPTSGEEDAFDEMDKDWEDLNVG